VQHASVAFRTQLGSDARRAQPRSPRGATAISAHPARSPLGRAWGP